MQTMIYVIVVMAGIKKTVSWYFFSETASSKSLLEEGGPQVVFMRDGRCSSWHKPFFSQPTVILQKSIDACY